MKRVLLALFLCATLTAAKSPKPAVGECAPVGTMVKRLMSERKLAYLSDAIDSNDQVHMWFISKKSGAWVELQISDDLQACIARDGYDWHFAVGE